MISRKWLTSQEDIGSLIELRESVFCAEQGYPTELESDIHDKTDAFHLAVYDEDMLIGVGRLYLREDGWAKLGRIALKRTYRKRGLGGYIVDELVAKAKKLGAAGAYIDSQSYAVGFYEKYGFSAFGVEFMDVNIPHVHMGRNFVFDCCNWLEFSDGLDAALFRREFDAENISSAEIKICALGFFELYFNGKRVGEDLNIPGWSYYEKTRLDTINMPISDELSSRIYYVKYDVTDYLQNGKNTLGVHIGSGWYGQHESFNEGFGRMGELKLCYLLTVKSADGGETRFVSDENGKWMESFVRRSNIYFGEEQDFRYYHRGWNENGFECNGLRDTKKVRTPQAILCEQDFPADRVLRCVTPKLLSASGDRKTYDLGENIAGYAVLRFSSEARANDRVYIRYSEEINPDGSLDFFSAGGTNRLGMEYFRAGADNGEELYPRFTWHAGRYIELTGKAEMVEFRLVASFIPVTAEFSSSDETLNWIFDAYVRTQQSNIHGCVPSDCPHRERLGYTGDGQLASNACMTVFASRDMYKKWMRDIADSQDRTGGHVQHTAPFYGGGGGPGGWGGAMVIVPWHFYEMYGDRSVLEKYYPHMRKYLDYMKSRSEDCLVVREEPKGWCLGDWCTPGNKIEIPEPFVNTYFLIKTLGLTLKAAKLLGIEKDIPELETRIAACKGAMFRNYFNPGTGDFCDGIQGANAFAVDIGLGDEKTLRNLVKKYEDLGEYDTGIFGTDILTRVLFEHGYGELAFSLLTSKGENSFYNMLSHGATTLWEEWDGANSHSHPMFGAVVEYLFSFILGIRRSEGSAGYEKYEVKPEKIAALEWVKGKISTQAGDISVEIRNGEIVRNEFTGAPMNALSE